MNWFKESQKSQLYRQLPFAPLNVDKTLLSSDDFMHLVSQMETLEGFAKDKKQFMANLIALKKSFLGMYDYDGQVGSPEIMSPENRPRRY